MKTFRPIFRACVATAALAFATPAAWAGIDVQVGSGNVAAILEKETELHLNAVRQAVLARPWFVGERTFMSRLQKQLWDSTIARIDYTYTTPDGASVTRSYHARSGRSIGGTIDDISGNSSSSGSSSSGSGSGNLTANDIDIRMDIDEGGYYPRDTLEDVRVRNLNPRGSTVQVANADYRRVRDAELKAFRHIEHDIRQGAVPEGGRITGYVSQPPCDSCANVIRNFGEQFHVSGDVYHLVPETVTGSRAGGEIAASNRAAGRYFQARRRAIVSALQVDNVKAPAPATWGADTAKTIANLEATEQGRPAATCRD